jgi:hypothetical protein
MAEDSRESRWRTQLAGGSNLGLGPARSRPWGPRRRPARGQGPGLAAVERGAASGAHEAASPGLQGSIATP